VRALARHACAALVLVAAGNARAAKIDVVGLSPGKAIVSVDGASPRTVGIGDTIAGFKVLAVTSDAATFLVDGRRETVAMGSYVAGRADHGRATAVLGPDTGGHYLAQGAINGTSTRFLVDTGATMVILSSREADRLHLVWANGPQAAANTANGRVAYRMVRLDRVKVGDVELTGVDAGVLEGYDGPNLLGMSFLSRTEVSRDGQSMVLTRRF
jgi:aspartyl protease family protein